MAVDLDQEDSGIETYIYNAATSSLNEANLVVGNDDVDSILTIEIRWVEGTLTDYAVRFRLGPTESAAPNIIHAFECNGCTGPELLVQVAQAVEAVVPPAVATKTSAPDPKPVTSQPDELQTTQPRAASRPEPPVQDQPMVVAGAVTLGLGFSGMVGVVGSLLAGDAYGIPRGRIEWPLFGVASGVALIGASLIGAGVAIDRKRVKLLPGLGSLGLSVRF